MLCICVQAWKTKLWSQGGFFRHLLEAPVSSIRVLVADSCTQQPFLLSPFLRDLVVFRHLSPPEATGRRSPAPGPGGATYHTGPILLPSYQSGCVPVSQLPQRDVRVPILVGFREAPLLLERCWETKSLLLKRLLSAQQLQQLSTDPEKRHGDTATSEAGGAELAAAWVLDVNEQLSLFSPGTAQTWSFCEGINPHSV